MKFAIVLAALAFVGISSASPTPSSEIIIFTEDKAPYMVSTTTTCRIGGPASDLDKRAMHECLIKYRNGNWNGMGCGARGWFKGGRSWDNPDHCYDGCASCISEAINRGANDVQCDQNVGFASCWMGYH